MKIVKYFIYLITFLLLILMLAFGVKAHQQAKIYEDVTTQIVVLQDAGEQAKLKLESWAKSLFRGLYKDDRRIHLDELREKQLSTMAEAKKYVLYFMVTLFITFLLYFITSLRYFTIIGSISAIITLVFGLITPILMVTIHKEVEYLGDVILSFESKGIIGSISKLFENGDIVVAIVILLFSVVIPVFKILSLFFVSIFIQSKFAHKIVYFLKMIGKWSMIDVFVVAVFLVYLTANKGDVSKAEVEVGLYFFLAYVISSMLVSLSADKMLQRLK